VSNTISLLQIQKLQFSDKAKAEKHVLEFLQKNEDPSIASVELKPKPESLNSINGFVTYANGERYFFKSHVEENEKVSEYYNASVLADAGYPVITARRIKQQPGQQIAFYEVLSLPTLFDELKAEEDWQRNNTPSTKALHLIQAQNELDKTVGECLHRTLRVITAAEHARAPIHQLFAHRLAEDGRLGLFYRNQEITLDQNQLTFEELASMRWTINGAKYAASLQDIIEMARDLLVPRDGPASIGHGDAHNGNIFVNFDLATGGPLESPTSTQEFGTASSKAKLVMFDPAFAGLHNPILDVTKAIFHNHFARWMYFPEEAVNEFGLSYSIKKNRIYIEHDFQPSSLRRQLLRIKVNNVLEPLLDYLDQQNMLANNWPRYLRSALFCCPFLTVNLFAPDIPGGTLAERYTLPIKLLGLAMSVELACESRSGSNSLAETIDEIFQ
jgi:hypothetical protein